MSVVPTSDRTREWTVADLDELPEDTEWRCYEIVDGALVVSPSPMLLHDVVCANIHDHLKRTLPGDARVLLASGVEMGRSYRIPDLVVVPRDLAKPLNRKLRTSEVHLAVEVVSPSSVTTDRITKPAQYAAAGIGNYWRVETDPVSVTAYELRGDVYAEVGTWGAGETARIAAPFPVEIEVDRLV